jgi:hypothetical protein
MYKTKAKKNKVKNGKDRTLNDCFAATFFSYNKRGRGWSELAGSGFMLGNVFFSAGRMRTRGKNAKRQQGKNYFPITAEQCWDQQPFKGKVHT